MKIELSNDELRFICGCISDYKYYYDTIKHPIDMGAIDLWLRLDDLREDSNEQ